MNGLEALEKLPKWLDDEHRDSEEEYFKASEEYKTIEKELKAFEIIKNHAKGNKHFKYLLYMAKYWEENKVKVTKELLYNYYFPYTIDEFELLKEVMK